MALIFKYKKIQRPGELGELKVPAIPVTLVGKKDKFNTVALLDSGADFTAIPQSVAEIIGVDLSGKKEDIIGIGGKIPAVETIIGCIIRGPHEKYSFNIRTKVILDEKEDFPILIGREGFFHHFDITFRERQEKIILKRTKVM